MMWALVKVQNEEPARPSDIPAPTRRALLNRGLIELYSPEELHGMRGMFPGVHPDRLRVTEAGKPYATLARLGVRETPRRKRRRR